MMGFLGKRHTVLDLPCVELTGKETVICPEVCTPVLCGVIIKTNSITRALSALLICSTTVTHRNVLVLSQSISSKNES